MKNFKPIFTASFISGLSAIISYGTTLYFTRLLGVEKYGEYAYYIGWSGLIGSLIDFSSSSLFSKVILSSTRQKAFNLVTSVKLYLLFIITSILLMLITFGYNPPFISFCFILPFFYLGGIYEFDEKNTMFSLILLFERIFILGMSILILFYFGLSIQFYLSYFFINSLILMYQFLKNKSLFLNFKLEKIRECRTHIIKYWPAIIVVFNQLAYGNISRLIIENKFGIEVFANVTIAFQIIALGQIFQLQVDRFFRPKVLNILKDKVMLNKILLDYLIFGMVPIIILSLSIRIFSHDFVSLFFGKNFYTTSLYLNKLYPLLILISISKLLDVFYIGLDKIKYNMIIGFFTSISMLIILYIFSSNLMLNGIFLTLIISYMVHIIISIFFINKFLKDNKK